MAEKLMTFKGGSLGDGSTTPVIHEETEKPEVPILPQGFGRDYALDAEQQGPERVELPPRTVKEPQEELHNVPGSTTDPQAAKTKLEQEQEALNAEIEAKWSEGGQV